MAEVKTPTTVLLFSGGIESTVLAYQLRQANHDVHLLGIDYGQRHRKEHEFAQKTAELLGLPFREVDLRAIGPLVPGNALLDPAVPVPDHGGPVPGRAIVVPNRNVILLSIAFAAAVTLNADQVAIGAMAGDSRTGDCTQAFVDSFNAMERVATADCAPGHLVVVAPLVHLQKHEVIHLGDSLGVPWGDTWSCFRDGELQCGTCVTCHDRRTGFEKADVSDPTTYAGS
ncbi:7-cyano-7-deazaguanine synthase [Streptomyces canus]|uniref:7-cyano-7-deazaguanine synthase n=1 Tax=Streptomyces canus TaxID=58343 RepID=UPI002E2CB891|nr:7-cyano-7-deazaguanine synthase [Streptomyces canus]